MRRETFYLRLGSQNCLVHSPTLQIAKLEVGKRVVGDYLRWTQVEEITSKEYHDSLSVNKAWTVTNEDLFWLERAGLPVPRTYFVDGRPFTSEVWARAFAALRADTLRREVRVTADVPFALGHNSNLLTVVKPKE